jgi:hypothetical protein
MRALLFVCLAAACGSSNHAHPDGATGDGTAGGDAVIPDRPLADRLKVTTIDAPGGVLAGDSNWRIWGLGSLRVAPVYTVPGGPCGTMLVGYTTTGPAAPVAAVAA